MILIAFLLIVVLNFVVELDKTSLWGPRIKVGILWEGHKIWKNIFKYFWPSHIFKNGPKNEINREILLFDFNQQEKIPEMQKVCRRVNFFLNFENNTSSKYILENKDSK